MVAVTSILAQFVADFKPHSLPIAVSNRARHLMTDFIGSIVRAGHEAESTPSMDRMLASLELDRAGECTVFGRNQKYTPPIAALLNGYFGHSLDFDDTHADSSLHPSAPVVPAAFAAAEMTNASGAELLTAIVLGYEVCCRLGNALDPTSHYARGFHPTATAGTFGAAAAAGRLFELDATQLESAFGVCGSQAAGSLQFLTNGAWNKRYQVGASAMNGLIAATLAKDGFLGASEAIEGTHGFLAGYTDDPKPERAVEGLGKVYETMKIGLKPYPSCRYTHAAIDGLIDICAEEQWDGSDITSVIIGLHKNGIVLTGEPLEEKRRPKSIVDGQFSMPFTAAVAIHKASFGWDDYDLLSNAEIEKLCDRVDVFADPQLENARHPFGASISISNGAETIVRLIADPSGEPDTFPKTTDLEQKFFALTLPVLGNSSASLFGKLCSIEELPSIRTLLD